MQHVQQVQSVIRAKVHKSLVDYQKWNVFKVPEEGQPTLSNTVSCQLELL